MAAMSISMSASALTWKEVKEKFTPKPNDGSSVCTVVTPEDKEILQVTTCINSSVDKTGKPLMVTTATITAYNDGSIEMSTRTKAVK